MPVGDQILKGFKPAAQANAVNLWNAAMRIDSRAGRHVWRLAFGCGQGLNQRHGKTRDLIRIVLVLRCGCVGFWRFGLKFNRFTRL